MNVTECRGVEVAIEPEQQKITDCGVVQISGEVRMQANAIQYVTEEKDIANLGIEKRFNSKMIARTKKFLVAGIPDRKSKIAAEMLDAFLAPCGVGLQNQFGVSVRRRAVRLRFF